MKRDKFVTCLHPAFQLGGESWRVPVCEQHGCFMNTHSVRQRVVYFSLCLFWKQPPLGWQLIAERVKGAFAWSGQPSSRSYPDWKASRWKATCTFIPANIRQGVSEDKEIWKKGGNDRRGKGVALHWQVKFTNKLKMRTASTISSSNILRIQRNNKSEEDIYYCKGCCITSLVSSGRTVKWK